jgi:hypothetical protein
MERDFRCFGSHHRSERLRPDRETALGKAVRNNAGAEITQFAGPLKTRRTQLLQAFRQSGMHRNDPRLFLFQLLIKPTVLIATFERHYGDALFVGMKRKISVYEIFDRYLGKKCDAGLPELSYPFHDRDVLVTACGRLCLHRKRINISTVLAGQKLGIKEVDEGLWLVSFMHYDLDTSTWSRKPCHPSTTRSARGCHPFLRYVLVPLLKAREKAANARQLVLEGRDPLAAREAQQSRATFGEAADALIESMSPSWRNEKHPAQWTMTLTSYCQQIRSKPVAEITTDDVLAVLEPLWRSKSRAVPARSS